MSVFRVLALVAGVHIPMACAHSQLHAAMLELAESLDATAVGSTRNWIGLNSDRTPSVFCPVDDMHGSSYTKLLEEGQAAFSRRDFMASRACYLGALHRYWSDFDVTAHQQLSRDLDGDVAKTAHDAMRMQQSLQSLFNQAVTRGDADQSAPRELEHHVAGEHAAPPGAQPMVRTEAQLGLAPEQSIGKAPTLQASSDAAPRSHRDVPRHGKGLASDAQQVLSPQRDSSIASGVDSPPTVSLNREEHIHMLAKIALERARILRRERQEEEAGRLAAARSAGATT